MPTEQLATQVDRLVELGYPALVGLKPDGFRNALAPLADQVGASRATAADPLAGRVPFVLVITADAVPVDRSLALVEREGRTAVEKLYPKAPADFVDVGAARLPAGQAYLAGDIERGEEYLNVTPDDAFEAIVARGRSPLTMAEGVALLTHYPQFLQPNRCFSLLASRAGDKRVPALWLSAGRPKLGWCWAGNPHTWLGSAYCGRRSEAVPLPVPAPDGVSQGSSEVESGR